MPGSFCNLTAKEELTLDLKLPVPVDDVCLESSYTGFTVSSETRPDEIVRWRLPLRRVEAHGTGVLARYSKQGTAHWSAPVALPRPLQFSVHQQGSEYAVQTGLLEPSGPGQSSAQLPPNNLVPGREYEVRVPKTHAVLPASLA